MPKAKAVKKKPTSARLLKHRPVDPDPPTENEVEAELLKTPENKRAKQQRLAGMEDHPIKDLEDVAMDYAEVRDNRISLGQQEHGLKQKLLGLMKANNKETYRRDGVEIRVVHESETVKVKVKPEEE